MATAVTSTTGFASGIVNAVTSAKDYHHEYVLADDDDEDFDGAMPTDAKPRILLMGLKR
jgi:hypothetical protein